MRADRLLSILMLLQTRGKLTAKQLSEELEVTERTIYRDITALSTAGIPVYSLPGREGGYALVESYRTDLTGLSENEVQALFMLSIPEPFGDLGLREGLQTALLKLSAALPDRYRRDEQLVRARFHLDAHWWEGGGEAVPFLKQIQEAVWDDRQLSLTYNTVHAQPVDLIVEPYGLVAKAGVWYLVYCRGGGFRVIRVSEVLHVELLPGVFERDETFELVRFWQDWVGWVQVNRQGYPVRARVSPGLSPALIRDFGGKLVDKGNVEVAADSWVEVDLAFESLFDARRRLLGYGGAVEVLAPIPLRMSMADAVRQTVKLYAEVINS